MTMKMKNDTYYGTELGDTGTRLVALFVDNVVLGIITGILFGSAGHVAWIISFAMTLAYNGFFLTQWEGQTPGKRLMGLRVVKSNGTSITLTDALIRTTGYYVNTMFMMIGWIWALFDEQKRGWHDLMAGTVVVKS